MFTGLVLETGVIRAIRPHGSGRALTLSTVGFSDLVMGESIACDGVCLTVEDFGPGFFQVTCGEETLRRTTFAHRQVGDRVHMERALRLGDRLGGHWVQGHVDGVGTLSARRPASAWLELDFAAPPAISRYIVEKGSICIDGVSLTVNAVAGDRFSVGIIPHTAQVTKLGALRPGDPVNLEVDVLARYVEKLLGRSGGLTLEKLQDYGFAGEER